MSGIEKKNLSIDGVEAKDNRLINHFFHDFKGKISTVIMCIDAIKDGTYGRVNPFQISWLQRAEKNCLHMVRLINNFRDLTQIEEGTFPHERQDRDLLEFLNTLKLQLTPPAKERNLELVFNIDEEIPEAIHTEPLLERVLQDLYFQSLDNTGQEGAFYSNVSFLDDSLRFDISFEGVEIGEELLQSVFNKYDQTNIGLQLGRGFTLLFCREAVRFMGGEVELRSWPGHGNRVTLRIPITQPEPLKKE